ncbi:RNA methyltransferase [Gaopeijia maritima]|uniref:tRNA (cytidine/uridine-2'-O-)-methyltransferase TrmJ n=1 Tax=Gaopeijia maritima TaxID=3119007 RepID=A0ABU9E7H5_9BACT
MSASLLDRIVVVLDHPKDVVNIAAVMRAMMNMGLSTLRLVRPDEFDPYRIEGIAHRSGPLIESTTIVDTLAEAVEDCVFVVGTTARARTANRNYVRPRPLAAEMLERAAEGPVALVFGREDRGLTNEGLDLCHRVAIIPTHAEYSSLNLAQAFLVLAYELHLAAVEGGEALPEGRRADRPATLGELEGMYEALQNGLGRIDFFKGTRRADAVVRTLRTVLSRADLDRRESKLIQAIGFEIGNYMDRHQVQADRRPVPGPEGRDHDGSSA